MRWRWLVPVLLVAAVVSLPGLLASRPVHGSTVDPAALLARIRSSSSVPWSGYGESRGGVALPDVDQLGDLASLLGTTSRYRVWAHDAQHVRVDALSLTGEKDTARDPDGTWHWDSDADVAVRVLGAEPVRLPDESDLVAPVLGQRLAGTQDVALSALPSRRVAGRTVPGVRLTPVHPKDATVQHVDLFADSRTGLVLDVVVQAVGQRVPVLDSVMLSMSFERPSLALASFDPEQHATTVSGKDLAAQVDQRSPYVLPAAVGGLVASHLLTGAQGLATYGRGFGQAVLLPLARGQGRDLAQSLREVGSRFDTPLLHGLLVEDGFRRRYLLAGTVPATTLAVMAQDLLNNPPPVRADP